MSFVRAKKVKVKPKWWRREREDGNHYRVYHYLVESYRESGKVRQRTLAYLGEYPTVEEALARLPQEIERWTEKDLPWACRQRDEAKTAYQELIARAEKPLVIEENPFASRDFQERWHRKSQAEFRDKRIPRAERKYLAAERSVRFTQEHIAELEARLAKLQALSTSSCSAQEIPGPGTSVGTTV
jgi:hypothetical protein